MEVTLGMWVHPGSSQGRQGKAGRRQEEPGGRTVAGCKEEAGRAPAESPDLAAGTGTTYTAAPEPETRGYYCSPSGSCVYRCPPKPNFELLLPPEPEVHGHRTDISFPGGGTAQPRSTLLPVVLPGARGLARGSPERPRLQVVSSGQ